MSFLTIIKSPFVSSKKLQWHEVSTFNDYIRFLIMLRNFGEWGAMGRSWKIIGQWRQDDGASPINHSVSEGICTPGCRCVNYL